MSNSNIFKITTLGTASAMPVVNRNQSAQTVNLHGRLFLIDCGEAVQKQLVTYRQPLAKLEAIFISHIHGDHCFGLFGLLSTLGMSGRLNPIDIYGPATLSNMIRFFLSWYGDGLAFEIRFHPLTMKSIETIYSSKSFSIEAFPLNHKIETFGFRFRENEPMWNVRKEKIEEYGLTLTEIGTLKRGEDLVRGDKTIPNALLAYKPYSPRSYAYCSDTAPFPQAKEWLDGTTMLYHEATYLQEYADLGVKNHHSTTLQAAALAKEISARKLIIAHYSSRCQDISLYEKECRSIFPATFAASDGDIFDVPE